MKQSTFWVTFNDPGQGECGYCHFDPETDQYHYRDGFGHSQEIATGKVHGDQCQNCRAGRFCEKAHMLEQAG